MATVDMLERLRMIQASFAHSPSLEAAVANERISKVMNRTEQIIRQRAFLRDERRRLRVSTEQLNKMISDLKQLQKPQWFPPGLICDRSDKRLRLNVGGMVFECRESILKRDEGSLLAMLSTPMSPVQPDPEGVYYFDRDWWLFRYVMMFLRDGTLPDDRQLLKLIYKEANFWKLRQLQLAIEEEKLHLEPHRQPAGADYLGALSPAQRETWWRQNTNSLMRQRDTAVNVDKEKNTDWWTGTKYRGRDFGPLSTDPNKVITEQKAPDASPMLEATWSRQQMNSSGSYSNVPSSSLYKPLPRPNY